MKKYFVFVLFLLNSIVFSFEKVSLPLMPEQKLLEIEKVMEFNIEQNEIYLNSIMQIKIDNEENMYFQNFKLGKILKFDKKGKFIKTIGKKGQGPGEVEMPLRFEISQNNKILIPDRKFIQIFDLNGKFIEKKLFSAEIGQIRNIEKCESGYLIKRNGVLNKKEIAVLYSTDSSFNKINEIYSWINDETKASKDSFLRFFDISSDNFIYVSSGSKKEYLIYKLNAKGNILKEIRKEYTPLYEFRKGKKQFKKAIGPMAIDNLNRVYLITPSEDENNKGFCIDVLSKKDKLIGRFYLGKISPYFGVYNNKLYIVKDGENGMKCLVYKIIKKEK